jgi:hypothetical protein
MSDMFSIEQETLKVKLFGEVVEFRAPTSVEEESVQEEFKNYDSQTSAIHPMQIYKNFLINLGISKAYLDKMSSKNIMDLFAFSIGSKKN